jgi:hypothetical protein
MNVVSQSIVDNLARTEPRHSLLKWSGRGRSHTERRATPWNQRFLMRPRHQRYVVMPDRPLHTPMRARRKASETVWFDGVLKPMND